MRLQIVDDGKAVLVGQPLDRRAVYLQLHLRRQRLARLTNPIAILVMINSSQCGSHRRQLLRRDAEASSARVGAQAEGQVEAGSDRTVACRFGGG